jgi:hypothetical protein
VKACLGSFERTWVSVLYARIVRSVGLRFLSSEAVCRRSAWGQRPKHHRTPGEVRACTNLAHSLPHQPPAANLTQP